MEAAGLEAGGGDRRSHERGVVDGIHRQDIGPCEGAVGARGQHEIGGDEGGERHELSVGQNLSGGDV